MKKEDIISIVLLLLIGSVFIYSLWDAQKEIGARIRIENMLIDAGVVNGSSILTHFYLAKLDNLSTEEMLKHLYREGHLTKAEYQYWLREYQDSLEAERGFGLIFVFIFVGWSLYAFFKIHMKEKVEKMKKEVR